MNKQLLVALGFVVLFMGVAFTIMTLIIPQVALSGAAQITDSDQQLINLVFYLGIVVSLFGATVLGVGIIGFVAPSQPVTQPLVTESISPKSVELGNTPEEVQVVMGQPDKIINLDVRVIHVYKDMKVIYVGGKVADVQ